MHNGAAAGAAVSWTASVRRRGRSSWRRQREPGGRDTVRAVDAEQGGSDGNGPRQTASLPAAAVDQVRRQTPQRRQRRR